MRIAERAWTRTEVDRRRLTTAPSIPHSEIEISAAVRAGLPMISASVKPTRPSAPANHQSVAGATQRTPYRPR